MPHVVAKLTACVRTVPKSALVVNLAKEKVTLGGGVQSLNETFDQILTVQRTDKEVSVLEERKNQNLLPSQGKLSA